MSDHCLNSGLRPDVRALTNSFNEGFNEGYIFGLVQYRNGRRLAESMGVCLNEPMSAGKIYVLSFDIGNLRNDAPDLIFSLFGIDQCKRLGEYRTVGSNAFCQSGLSNEQLADVDVKTLGSGWNSIEFMITPFIDIEAIFYGIACDFEAVSNDEVIYMVLDNVSIRELYDLPEQMEIVTSGQACEGNLLLSVDDMPNYGYQWFKDSLILTAAIDAELAIHENTELSSGIYHVLVTDEMGSCRLSHPLIYTAPTLMAEKAILLCEGEGYYFAGKDLKSAGIYSDTLRSVHGCDSIVQLTLEVQSIIQGDTLYVSQTEGTSYTFHGAAYTETGVYEALLPSANGCDSITYLSLTFTEVMKSSAVFIPNAFSPNADGQNDYFQPEGRSSILELIHEMKIFDRWGELIFQQTKTPDQPALRWDGSIRGQPAAVGVYFYVVSQIDQNGITKYYTGDILLLR